MSRKLIIGIVGVRGIPNSYGGFERFIELLVANDLFTKTVEFRIYVEEQEDNEYLKNVKLVNVGISKSISPFRFYIKSAYLSSKECDVTFSCGVGISLGSLFVKFRGKRLVVNPDGLEWHRSKWNKLQRFLIKLMYIPALELSDRIIFDSQSLIQYFPNRYVSKSVFIPYQAMPVAELPTDYNKFKDLRITGPFILVIARLEPENSILEVINAYRFLNSKYQLVVVGNTDTRYYRQRLLHFNEDVIFTSGIYDQNILNSLRRNCLAYIHGHTVGGTNPSLLEAIVTVEAPILAKDTTFNREVLGFRGNYFKNSDDLVKYLSNLSACNINNPQNLDQRYTEESIAKSYLNVFES